MQSSPAAVHVQDDNLYEGVADSDFPPWLWGAINRKEADAALRPHSGEDGVFLLRSRGADQHALSLTAGGKMEHHVVAMDLMGCYTVNGRALSRPCYTLQDVVACLRTNDDTTLVSARLRRGLPAP